MANTRRRALTGDSRDRLAADLKRQYEKGASIRALAEETGRSYGFVRRMLGEAGAQIRGSGSQRAAKVPRAEARRLLEAVPDDRVSAAVSALRQVATQPDTGQPRRRFRTVGVFEGEPDLGRRAKETARRELGGDTSKTA